MLDTPNHRKRDNHTPNHLTCTEESLITLGLWLSVEAEHKKHKYIDNKIFVKVKKIEIYIKYCSPIINCTKMS